MSTAPAAQAQRGGASPSEATAVDHEAVVTVPRGPRGLLSYGIPVDLVGRVEVGRRVLVPLGKANRRITAYVIDVRAVAAMPTPDFALKAVLDVLVERALFDLEMLSLFRFIADYYCAPLGDVIRGGLPGGLNVHDARRLRLTDAGKAAATDPRLHGLDDGMKVDAAPITLRRLHHLVDDGLITIAYELERPSAVARYASIISAAVPALPDGIRAGGLPAQTFALLLSEGPMESSELSAKLPGATAAVRRLTAVGAVTIEKKQVFRDPWHGAEVHAHPPPVLTAAQARAVHAITNANGYEGFLLFGVTGSGKTEVYLESLRIALERGQTGLVLVPEIALTPQLAGRFRARFGDDVAVLHSALSDGERLDQWELIRRGQRRIVVGARSALFAPLPRLGVIVVDEEHEGSFKQDESPRYHARDLALYRGRQCGCPVVLGSATPSLETWVNAEKGRLTRLDLPGRVGDRDMPQVEFVDVADVPYAWPEALLTAPLVKALEDTVARGEQAIVFLNRRGYAPSFTCRACEAAVECPSCTIGLTFHRRQRRLACHLCGFQTRLPERCPKCQSHLLEHEGTGTEQVEAVLTRVLPSARIGRMDRDTTRGDALTELLDAFRSHEIDILVGTQMVAKGHDFPKVTFVGVLQGEHSLGVPDFRAAERTFQLMTQVAGRAGRHDRPGTVLIQTSQTEHYALKASRNHDFLAFVTEESRRRRRLGNPPFGYIVLLRLDALDPRDVSDAAGLVARTARNIATDLGLDVAVVGPSLAPIERIRGRTRYLVLLKSAKRNDLHTLLHHLVSPLSELTGDVKVHIDVDPQSLS